MAQAVSHWPFIAKGPVKSIASQCGICGGPSDTGRDLFFPSLSLSSHQHSIFIFLFLLMLSEGQAVDSGNVKKHNGLSDARYHWTEMYRHLQKVNADMRSTVSSHKTHNKRIKWNNIF